MFKLTKATMPQAMQAVCEYYGNYPSLWRNMPVEWNLDSTWRTGGTAAKRTGIALSKAQLLRVVNALVADGRCSRSKAHGLMHYTMHDLDQQPNLAKPGTVADAQFMLDEQPDHVLQYIAEQTARCDRSFAPTAMRMVRQALAKRGL